MKFMEIIYITFGVLLLFLSSQLTIPIHPIPITMQTVGVMLIALMYNIKMAIIIVLIYLVLGASGIPVFADYRSGIKVLFGPSGGYLFGFLAAVILMATLKKYLNNSVYFHIFANCCLGTLCILFCGVSWLGYKIGFKPALHAGFYPFITPGLLKILIASVIFYFGMKLRLKISRVFNSIKESY